MITENIMKITTISNIDCLLTEKEVLQILKIDRLTFRKVSLQCVQISERVKRYEPKDVSEFIKQKKINNKV